MMCKVVYALQMFAPLLLKRAESILQLLQWSGGYGCNVTSRWDQKIQKSAWIQLDEKPGLKVYSLGCQDLNVFVWYKYIKYTISVLLMDTNGVSVHE